MEVALFCLLIFPLGVDANVKFEHTTFTPFHLLTLYCPVLATTLAPGTRSTTASSTRQRSSLKLRAPCPRSCKALPSCTKVVARDVCAASAPPLRTRYRLRTCAGSSCLGDRLLFIVETWKVGFDLVCRVQCDEHDRVGNVSVRFGFTFFIVIVPEFSFSSFFFLFFLR